MALLNPPDIVPEAMRYLVRALLAVQGQSLPREDLVRLVAPPGLAEAMVTAGAQTEDQDDDGGERDTKATGRTIAEASVDALRSLDMLVGGRDLLSLGAPVASRWTRARNVTATEFAGALLTVIREHYGTVGAPASGAADDLVDGLAMLYAADDPFDPFTAFDSARATRRFVDWQRERLGDDDKVWPLFNRERWNPFRRWAVYLGVGRVVGPALLPEASIAIERGVRMERRDYPVEEFLRRCVASLPFMDASGTPFGHDAEATADHAVLSPGLSLTLATLRTKGLVEIDRRSDTGGRTLRIRPDRSLDERVTHVRWNGAQARMQRAS